MAVFFVLICIVGIIALAYWIIPANPFPKPSGEWQVGTSDLIWDSSIHTGIIAKVWYPTNVTNGIQSPYIDNRTLSGITAQLNPLFRLLFNKFYIGRIITPTFSNVTPAQHQGGFPVILLSPGSGGMNFLNTFYALEFTSYGFIVVGINHPGSSGGALLTDGTQINFNTVDNKIFEDVDMFAPFISQLIVEQSSNISMVLDRVIDLNYSPESFLNHKIDPSKIYAAGHSLGGAASFMACGKDKRISKGVNLDGAFYDASDTNYTGKRLLLIHADRDRYRPKNKTAQTQFDTILSGDKLQIQNLSDKADLQMLVFDRSNHVNFTDIPIIIQPRLAKAMGLIGEIDGLELLLETSRVIIKFFNKQP